MIVETARGIEYGKVVLAPREEVRKMLFTLSKKFFVWQQRRTTRERHRTESERERHLKSVRKRFVNMVWK